MVDLSKLSNAELWKQGLIKFEEAPMQERELIIDGHGTVEQVPPPAQFPDKKISHVDQSITLRAFATNPPNMSIETITLVQLEATFALKSNFILFLLIGD
jgi:hypothetical protein